MFETRSLDCEGRMKIVSMNMDLGKDGLALIGGVDGQAEAMKIASRGLEGGSLLLYRWSCYHAIFAGKNSAKRSS
jgi:hypothetical protein